LKYLFIVIWLLTNSSIAKAASSFTYEGNLSTIGGVPVNGVHSFSVDLVGHSGAECVFYTEGHNAVNVVNGQFSFKVGEGTTPNFSGITTLQDFFNPNPKTNLSSCNYDPSIPSSKRMLRVSFYDGVTWLNMGSLDITSAPRAIVSDSLQGKGPGDFVTKNIGAEIPMYASDPATPPTGALWYNSTSNNLKYFNGSVMTLGTGGAGLATLSVTGDLTADGTPGGTLSAPGTIGLSDSGIGAGTYTKITVDTKGRATVGAMLAEADIPNLTTAGKVSGAAISAGTINASAIAPSAVTFSKIQNIATNKLLGRSTAASGVIEELNIGAGLTLSGGTLAASGGGGTVTSVSSANSDISFSMASPAPVATLNSGTGANQIVKLDGTAKLPAVDGSALTNLNAGNISTGTLPVARGGTGVTSLGNFMVLATNGSGAVAPVPGTVNGSILQYSATGPVYSTASYPTTTTANQLLFSSANNVVGGLATANNAILTTNGSGVPSWNAVSGDSFSQYALLAGRAGGQTLYGGTSANANLTLDSTSNATRGNIVLQPFGGNVGIGTTMPVAKLSIIGSDSPNTKIRLASSSANSAGDAPTLELSNAYNGFSDFPKINLMNSNGTSINALPIPIGQILGEVGASGNYAPSGPPTPHLGATIQFIAAESFLSGAAGTDILFRTASPGTITPSPKMTIAANGNVGIGTITPGAKLDVVGGDIWAGGIKVALGGIFGNSTDLLFGAGGTERMRILQGTGYIGIGTTSPSEKLHIVGNLRVQGSTDCTLGNGAAGTNCSSDIRLKENILEIDNSLEKILSLRGVEFDWNQKSQSPGEHAIGVIAQDVEKVFPTAVINDPGSGYKKVDYAVLVAPVIQAFKELNKRIAQIFSTTQQHKRDIASLKSSDNDKEKEIADLKAKDQANTQKIKDLEQRLERLEKSIKK
jgi:trimeric autotransporter adhesin